MNADDLIRRSDEARRVLETPVVKEAIESLKAEIVAQWAATPARDEEGREWVWRHYKVAERFEAMLNGYVETGRFERIKIEQSAKDRAISWFKRAA